VDNSDNYYEPKQLRVARSLIANGKMHEAMHLIRTTLRSLERSFERHHSVVLSFQLDVVRFLRECQLQRQANRMLLLCRKRVDELLGVGHPFDGRLPAELGITLTGYGLFCEAKQWFVQAQELLDQQSVDFNHSLMLEMAICWCECNMALDEDMPASSLEFITHTAGLILKKDSELSAIDPTVIKRIIHILSYSGQVSVLLDLIGHLDVSKFKSSEREWLIQLTEQLRIQDSSEESRERLLLIKLEQLLELDLAMEDLFGVLSELDSHFQEQGTPERTLGLAENILPRVKQKAGANSIQTAQYYRFCGDLAYLASNYHLSIEYFSDSLRVIQATNQSDSLELYAECQHNIGTCYVAIDDYPTALEFYQNALKCRKNLTGYEHMACESVLAIVLLLRIQARPRDALRYIRAFRSMLGKSKGLIQSLAWRRLQSIEGELSVKPTSLANKQNRTETSIIEEERLDLTTNRAGEPKSDLDVTAELYSRGLEYIENKEYRKAILAFERVIEIMKQNAATSNREIRPVIEMLVVGYQGLGDSSKADEMRSLRDSLTLQ